MISRRNVLKGMGAVSAAFVFPRCSFTAPEQGKTNIKFCLNTSTISGQGLALEQVIDITAKAGYDGIELWISDVQKYVSEGKTLQSLKKRIDDNRLTVENAIGFANWMVNDDNLRRAAFEQMEAEMRMMAELGCTRIAAPPAGATSGETLDLTVVAQRYRELIELGVKTGVMPQLEIWGASLNLSSLSQALFVAAGADHPKARILADVYHLYRGGSGFNGLRLLSGTACEIFHMNDYPSSPVRTQLTDSDRVFPGDGVAPVQQITDSLQQAGGLKILSLELFNRDYWKRDALEVAAEGLARMKKYIFN
jgi:sugar phosphate isomerase/epimerase